MRIAIILSILACSLLLTGCGADSESDDGAALDGEKARQLGGVTELLGCYTDEGGDKGYVCWVRFKDGATCLRSQVGSNYYSYSDCRGGFAATLPPLSPASTGENYETDFSR